MDLFPTDLGNCRNVTEYAIKVAGGATHVARTLECGKNNIYRWIANDRITERYLRQVADLSGIAPQRLRPDLAALFVQKEPDKRIADER